MLLSQECTNIYNSCIYTEYTIGMIYVEIVSCILNVLNINVFIHLLVLFSRSN